MTGEVFQEVISAYYRFYPDAEEIPVEVLVTDDLNRTHSEIRPECKEYLLSEQPQQDFNGRLVAPHRLDEPMNILLNEYKIIEYFDSRTWLGTIAHELTHAIDYYQMARLENLANYDIIDTDKKYNVFRLWSEYHARKKAYKFLGSIMSRKYFRSPEEHLKHIREEEWPFQRNSFLSNYENCSSDYDQIYFVMNLLGRYSVWCDLFPDSFNENSIVEDLEEFSWPRSLLSFLRSHETLETMYDDFGELDNLLWDYWIDF